MGCLCSRLQKKTRVIIKETLPTHGDKEIILPTIGRNKTIGDKRQFFP